MSRNDNAILLILTGIILFLVISIIFLVFFFIKRSNRLKVQAVSDTVTKALNTVGLNKEAEKYLYKQNSQYAVVMMRISNFRQICQTFGISNGDRVLVHLYSVLDSSLSRVEPIARINGNTFCFLLKNQQDNIIRARLSRIYESANHFNLQRRIPYNLDLHFGIYIPQNNSESFAEMQEKASLPLDHNNDESRYHLYKATTEVLSNHNWELIEEMDRSLQNGDFVIYLQPKVRLSDNRIVGAEVLARWKHPQRGMLTPEMFIPLLEEYHIIHLFDQYLLELICRKLAEWTKSGLKPCPISVNLSHRSLDIDNFLVSYAKMAQKYDIDPELIEFELSESILLEDPQKIRILIDEIHSCGFRCSLNNFGKTFIPLHLLRELDVDTIKLDRSFFTSENNSRRNRFIVEAILKLASQMQIHTVAEGIDNASQVQYLQQIGCDMIQGFYYFLPMSTEEFRNTCYQDGELRYLESQDMLAKQAGSSVNHYTSNSNIVMFSFLVGEDRVVFSDLFSPVQEGHYTLSSASSLFRHSDLIHENDRNDFFHLLDRCRKDNGWVENTLRFYTTEWRYEWLEVHLHKEQLKAAGDTVIFGTLVNTAGWKNEIKSWKEKANRDVLTGLFNREYFKQYTSNYLEKGTLSNGALVFIDVDDFKQVNDTLGHMVGDDVLCYIAKRLLGAFRHTDIVARYAGDEFVVFVNGISRAGLEKRLTQVCETFRFPYRNDTQEYHVSVSLGAAMYPEDGKTYSELLNHADCAVYVAKNQGKNRFVFYDSSLEGIVPQEELKD